MRWTLKIDEHGGKVVRDPLGDYDSEGQAYYALVEDARRQVTLTQEMLGRVTHEKRELEKDLATAERRWQRAKEARTEWVARVKAERY